MGSNVERSPTCVAPSAPARPASATQPSQIRTLPGPPMIARVSNWDTPQNEHVPGVLDDGPRRDRSRAHTPLVPPTI